MDLRQLEYFLAVAKRGSFTAAASELGLTQPSLTKTIRALEQELGVQLFERLVKIRGRGLRLTPQARNKIGVPRSALAPLPADRAVPLPIFFLHPVPGLADGQRFSAEIRAEPGLERRDP